LVVKTLALGGPAALICLSKYGECGRLRVEKEAVTVLERKNMPPHRKSTSILKGAGGTAPPFRRSALIPNY